jgi:hypothetical protein
MEELEVRRLPFENRETILYSLSIHNYPSVGLQV